MLLLAGSCGADPATQIIVVVRSELAAGTELAEIAIEVEGVSGEPIGDQRTFALAAERDDGRFVLPLSFVIVPPDGADGGRFRLVVRGLDDTGAEVIEQQVIAAFQIQRTVLLEIYLPKRCFQVLCRAEQESDDVACRRDTGRCEQIETRDVLPMVEPGDELDSGSKVSCASGLRPGVDGACEDIDECADDNGGCGDTRCENTYGSYGCGDCEPGFAEDAEGRCLDIDECVGGTADCPEGMSCRNVLGGFVCSCPSGFEAVADHCEDIDECDVDNGGCGADDCKNTDGSHACGACEAGFGEDGEGECVDLDECETGSANCGEHARCTNTEGSFVCDCDEGFEPTAVGCADIDECGSDNGGCGSMACVNEPGSHRCSTTECAEGLADCDDEPGCEADTRTSVHACGGCDNDCSKHPNSESATCNGGECVYRCATGYGDCTREPGCETRLNTLQHCGSCNAACMPDNATATCETGKCVIMSCKPGTEECNGKIGDGCEADLTSAENCGGCGVACRDGMTCRGDGCSCGALTDCPEGLDCCDGSCINTAGSCVFWPCVPGTTRNMDHCGACNMPCDKLACCG